MRKLHEAEFRGRSLRGAEWQEDPGDQGLEQGECGGGGMGGAAAFESRG